MKHPAFQFYPDKWQSDKSLRLCSIGARGLWIELMGVMHSCEPYGHLTDVDGSPMPDGDAAKLCGVERAEYRRLLAELERRGVPSRTDAGVLYSRRMVRDEAYRNARAADGRDGAKFGALGKEFGKLGGRPRLVKGGSETPGEGGSETPPKTGDQNPSVFVVASASVSKNPAVADGSIPSVGADSVAEANGRADKSSRKSEQRGQSWSSREWVNATAVTLNVERRNGEDWEGFADRVWTAAEARRKGAA